MEEVMEWMFVSLSNSYVEILTTNVIVLRDEDFGMCLGHESDPMNGISVFLIGDKKELNLSLFSFP